ncbi:MAG: hypothetical protein WC069_05930 [Candidatus Shapirobacteria bacterium]
MNKKSILKKACGKGGPGMSLSHIVPNLKKVGAGVVKGAKKVYNAHIDPVGGAKDILSAGAKGFSEAYKNNMAKYKNESGIDKNLFGDELKAGVKGTIYGGIKAGQKAVEELSPKKNIVKSAVVKAVGGNGARDIPSAKKTATPKGWDSQTYKNFKKANPNLEPDAEDTYRMRNAK